MGLSYSSLHADMKEIMESPQSISPKNTQTLDELQQTINNHSSTASTDINSKPLFFITGNDFVGYMNTSYEDAKAYVESLIRHHLIGNYLNKRWHEVQTQQDGLLHTFTVYEQATNFFRAQQVPIVQYKIWECDRPLELWPAPCHTLTN